MNRLTENHQHYALVFIEKGKVIMIRFHAARVDTQEACDEAWQSDQHDEIGDEALEFWSGKNRTRNGALEMLHKCGFHVWFEVDSVPEKIEHKPA